MADRLALSPAPAFGRGPLVPVPTNWDEPGAQMGVVSALSNVAMALHARGDPLTTAPGATLLVAGHCFMFSQRVPVRQWCLLPHRVLYHGEAHRLLAAALLHRNALHLLGNISSLLSSGLYLERRSGWHFVLKSLGLAVTANALRLLSMCLRARITGHSLHTLPVAVYGGLGFSAACLALQVVALEEPQREPQLAHRLHLPGQWRPLTCWATYGLHAAMSWQALNTRPQLLQADLEHDLCGVLAALAYIWCPRLWRSFTEARSLRTWQRTMYGTARSGQRLGGGSSEQTVGTAGSGTGAALTPAHRAALEAAAAREQRERDRAESLASHQERNRAFVGGTGSGVRLGGGSELDLRLSVAGLCSRPSLPSLASTYLTLAIFVALHRMLTSHFLANCLPHRLLPSCTHPSCRHCGSRAPYAFARNAGGKCLASARPPALTGILYRIQHDIGCYVPQAAFVWCVCWRFTISHHFCMAVRDVLAIPGWLRIARLRCGTRRTQPKLAIQLILSRQLHALPAGYIAIATLSLSLSDIVLDPLCSQYNTRQRGQQQVPHTRSCGHARALSQRSVARMQRTALRKALSSISIAQTPPLLLNGSHFNMGRRQCVDMTPNRFK